MIWQYPFKKREDGNYYCNTCGSELNGDPLCYHSWELQDDLKTYICKYCGNTYIADDGMQKYILDHKEEKKRRGRNEKEERYGG
jgi:DNA-directed RNA polymerase subunit RPC12/RpoP